MSGGARATVSILAAEELERRLRELGVLLHDCVRAGANINFVLPFPVPEATAYWRDSVLPRVLAGGWTMLAAWVDGRIAGTAVLIHDTPPNQRHRAEVSKLMVHPEHRRQGIARTLMAELEEQARRLDRSLITLDTRTGDAAETLYASLGYATVGVIPGFCRDPREDRLYGTTVMYKAL